MAALVLANVARGGYWQYQRHIYCYPFYHVDYSLAATCALQFWARAEEDRDGAMKAYVELCGRGGSMPGAQMPRCSRRSRCRKRVANGPSSSICSLRAPTNMP